MDKKAHIIQSAQLLFAPFGLKKVTADDIAKESRASKATIYKYFKNKAEIFDQVVQQESDQLLSAIEVAVIAESGATEKLEAHLKTRLGKVGEFVNFYRVTQDSWADYWPHIARIRKRFLADEQDFVVQILHDGVNSDELQIDDPENAALVLVLALASLEYQWSLDEGRFYLPELIDLMIKMMVYGIRKRK